METDRFTLNTCLVGGVMSSLSFSSVGCPLSAGASEGKRKQHRVGPALSCDSGDRRSGRVVHGQIATRREGSTLVCAENLGRGLRMEHQVWSITWIFHGLCPCVSHGIVKCPRSWVKSRHRRALLRCHSCGLRR